MTDVYKLAANLGGFGSYVNGTWHNQSTWTKSLGEMKYGTAPVCVRNLDLKENVSGPYPWSSQLAHDAIAASVAAATAWRQLGVKGRIEILQRWQTELEKHLPDFAKIISEETGKPTSQAIEETVAIKDRWVRLQKKAGELLATYNWPHAKDGTKGYLTRKPWGAACAIAPNNYPFRTSYDLVFNALIAGNTCTLKAVSSAPGSWFLATLLAQQAGIPPGVFNFIVGPGHELGKILAASPDLNLLMLTGGTDVGIDIKKMSAATDKQLLMELGGQSVVIALPDSDIEASARWSVEGAVLRNGGQNCNGTRIVIVVGDEKREKNYIQAIKSLFEKLIVGDPFDAATQIGPMMTPPKNFLATLEEMKLPQNGGAQILYQTPLPSGLAEGYWVQPTFYQIGQEFFRLDNLLEPFGPALGIIRVNTQEEAIALANRIACRLTAGVHTQDKENFMRVSQELDWGQVYQNRSTAGAYPEDPFGGAGWSVQGGFGGSTLLDHVVRPQTTVPQI